MKHKFTFSNETGTEGSTRRPRSTRKPWSRRDTNEDEENTHPKRVQNEPNQTKPKGYTCNVCGKEECYEKRSENKFPAPNGSNKTHMPTCKLCKCKSGFHMFGTCKVNKKKQAFKERKKAKNSKINNIKTYVHSAQVSLPSSPKTNEIEEEDKSNLNYSEHDFVSGEENNKIKEEKGKSPLDYSEYDFFLEEENNKTEEESSDNESNDKDNELKTDAKDEENVEDETNYESEHVEDETKYKSENKSELESMSEKQHEDYIKSFFNNLMENSIDNQESDTISEEKSIDDESNDEDDEQKTDAKDEENVEDETNYKSEHEPKSESESKSKSESKTKTEHKPKSKTKPDSEPKTELEAEYESTFKPESEAEHESKFKPKSKSDSEFEFENHNNETNSENKSKTEDNTNEKTNKIKLIGLIITFLVLTLAGIYTRKSAYSMQPSANQSPTQFNCDNCRKTCNKNYELKGKRKEPTHEIENSFNCGYCGETSDQNKNKCNYRKKSFNQGENLKKHKRTYTGNTPLLHPLIHSTQKNRGKPTKCDESNKSFRCVSDIKKHRRSYASNVSKNSSPSSSTPHSQQQKGRKPLIGDVCKKSFDCISDMKRHKKSNASVVVHKYGHYRSISISMTISIKWVLVASRGTAHLINIYKLLISSNLSSNPHRVPINCMKDHLTNVAIDYIVKSQ